MADVNEITEILKLEQALQNRSAVAKAAKSSVRVTKEHAEGLIMKLALNYMAHNPGVSIEKAQAKMLMDNPALGSLAAGHPFEMLGIY